MKTEPIAIALVLFSSFMGSIGMACLKAGANRLEMNIPALVKNWHLWLGITLFVVSSVFYVIAIKHGELSVIYPMVSLGYMWGLLWSYLFFKEPLTRNKFVGLGIILCGIVLLGLGDR